jgi:6-phosphogluconolactonase
VFERIRCALPALCLAGAALVLAVPTASAATTRPPGVFTSINDHKVFFYAGSGDPTWIDVGGEAFDSATSADGRTAYVLVVAGAVGAVVPIEVATHSAGPAVANFPADPGGHQHIALSPDGSMAYVSAAGAIYPIDLATGGVGTPISTVRTAMALAVSPNGKLIYATVGTTLLEINPRTASSKVLDLGRPGGAIKLSSNGATAYVIGDEVTGSRARLLKVDLASWSIVDHAAVPGGSVIGLALSPDQSLLYVTGVDTPNHGMGARFYFAAPVRASDLHVGAEIFISADEPFPLAGDAAFTPDGGTLYMFTRGRGLADYLVAIDTANQAVTKSTDLSLLTHDNLGLTSAVVPADQAPVAAFRATVTCAGTATAFDASASTVAAGTIVRYAWNFGDGSTQVTTGPNVSHTYAKAGHFAVTVTETDSAGTSTTVVFDGQTVLRNGGPSARAQHTITVGTCSTPGQVPPPPTGIPAAGAPVGDDDSLALTGSNTSDALLTSGLLIALGAGLTRAGRRRTVSDR